ncbi:hypothetical protein [Phycicoccus avicenniae]|uniref:hypothetical protein n=1 Tax=Phycicoccus avicenniae TaxID=2828860 RepID=UPI003D288BA7
MSPSDPTPTEWTPSTLRPPARVDAEPSAPLEPSAAADPSAGAELDPETAGVEAPPAGSAPDAPSEPTDPSGPSRRSRPAALYDELSRRPARSAAGRVAAHLGALVGTDAAPSELTQAWEQEQAPVSTGRRLWVVGGHGGAGATTLAACLAHELQARRLDGVALVDDAPGRIGLADRLVRPPHADVTTGSRQRHERSRSLLAYAPASAVAGEGERLATDLRRVAGMTLTDGGQRLPEPAARVEALLVVGECSVRGLGAAAVVLEEALRDGWTPERVLVVVSKSTPTSGVSPAKALRAVDTFGVTGLVLHHDRHLAGAAALDPTLLAPQTTVDVARIAAWAVRTAVARP